MIKGVIFDMDGVIADTEHFHYLAWREFLAKHGVDFGRETNANYFGIINFEMFKDLLPDEKEEDYFKLDEEKEEIYRKNANDLKPLPGAVELIRELHSKGFKLVIGSSGNPKNIEFNIDKLGLSSYFLGYVSSHDVKKGKPDPEVFLKAAELVRLKPEECVVIEDSFHGISAAKRAGMKVIAVSTTHQEEKLSKADLVVKTLKDLNIKRILDLR